jgi:hypothetical protein
MLHPRLTSLDGEQDWLASIGTYGAWSDLSYTFRWGTGACGMFEASWSMPLPADFDHPLLSRGTLVELMDGSCRVGSSLVLAEPGRGDGNWTLTATGVGSEAEGDNSFYALDGSGGITNLFQTAVSAAIARGLPWDGFDSSVPPGPGGGVTIPDGVQTVGALFQMGCDRDGTRWGVGGDDLVGFMVDPTVPAYQVVPGVAALGTADDDYATVVLVQYRDSTSHIVQIVSAPASPLPAEKRYRHREFLVDLTDRGEMPAASAQSRADGILANSKGRLGWTNGLTVTSNDILTADGDPADLSKVAEDVGSGCMVRLQGIFDGLLEYTGQTYLDIIIGEAKPTDGARALDLSPLGLAARDLASVVEAVAGPAPA